MIVVFAICIFFGATVPLLAAACLFYATVRHAVDCLNLITVFRKEIDSQGLLIESVTCAALAIVLCYQVCMMAFFYSQDRMQEAIACTFIFFTSIIFIVVN